MAGDNKVSMEKLKSLIERHKNEQGSLIGLLQDISEEYGYLPEVMLREVSSEIEVPLSSLFSLATFYTSFRLEEMGRHRICACVGTACHVKGAPKIVESLERELGIMAGETTEDKQFTLETVNCLGACALGPLVVIDGEYHGKVEQKRVSKLLEKYMDESPNGSGQ